MTVILSYKISSEGLLFVLQASFKAVSTLSQNDSNLRIKTESITVEGNPTFMSGSWVRYEYIIPYMKTKRRRYTLYSTFTSSPAVSGYDSDYFWDSFRFRSNMLSILLRFGVIFERKKSGTQQIVPNCYRTPILKFHFEMLLFNLAQGLRKC